MLDNIPGDDCMYFSPALVSHSESTAITTQGDCVVVDEVVVVAIALVVDDLVVFATVIAFAVRKPMVVLVLPVVAEVHAATPSSHVCGSKDPSCPHWPRHDPPVPQQLGVPWSSMPHWAQRFCVSSVVPSGFKVSLLICKNYLRNF